MNWFKRLKAFSTLKKALKEIASTALLSVSDGRKHTIARNTLAGILDREVWTDKRIDLLINFTCMVYKIYFKKS